MSISYPGVTQKGGITDGHIQILVKLLQKIIPLLVGWVECKRENPEEAEGWIQTIPLSSADSAEG